MSKEQKLKIDDILKKKFSVELSGYNGHEVDEFLDSVIKDYELYQETIKTLRRDIKDYQKVLEDKEHENKELMMKNENLLKQLKDMDSSKNINLKTQINELQEAVWELTKGKK